MPYYLKVTGAVIGLYRQAPESNTFYRSNGLLSVLLVSICILFTTGCVAPTAPPILPPKGSCSLALPATATDEEAIRAVLSAEGDLVVAQNIDALMKLWEAGAKITDAKNTPEEPQDDQAWLDKDAIRHRYVRTVFPGAPAQATPKDLHLQIIDNRAIVAATTQIGSEISPAGDRWILVKEQNCWVIQSLTYNLEAK